MIIRNNLATKPVKNYSLFFLGCVALSVVAIAFTIFNVRSITGWYVTSSNLQANIQAQQKKKNEFQRQAGNLRASIAKIRTEAFVAETEFMNNAIKRRVFSWTRLFDLFETTLPNNVKMISIAPSIGEENISINMEVAGRNLDDIVELMRVLQQTPAFRSVVFKSEKQDKDGLLHAAISLEYLPEKAESSMPVADAGPPSREEPAATESEELQEDGGEE